MFLIEHDQAEVRRWCKDRTSRTDDDLNRAVSDLVASASAGRRRSCDYVTRQPDRSGIGIEPAFAE